MLCLPTSLHIPALIKLNITIMRLFKPFVFLSVLSGNRGSAAGSSGDEIGKALASVSFTSLDLVLVIV